MIRTTLLVAIGAAVLACDTREPLAPEVNVHAALAAPDQFETGCTTFEVRMGSQERVAVVPLERDSCGPVTPVVAGSALYDPTTRVLRLPIALENRGTRKLRDPAYLSTWEDSLLVVAPAGLSRNIHSAGYLAVSGADSIRAADSAHVWRYDHVLAPERGPSILPVQARTGNRIVELRIHPGVSALRVTFHAKLGMAALPVPIAAPDTIPVGLYEAPGAVLEGSPHFPISNMVLRGVISLSFEGSATQAERQSAVDMVNGEVIGGQRIPNTEGFYLVRIEDDGTGRQMHEAMVRLNALPQVGTAQPEYLWYPEEVLAYAQPKDEGDFQRPWMLRADQANGRNWALEAIGAPGAWGCETGDRSQNPTGGPRMAVVDIGFHGRADLRSNVTYAPHLGLYSEGWYTGATVDHGTGVASVMGAKGNNGLDITGMMWAPSLSLYDISVYEDGRRNTVSSWVFWRKPAPVYKMILMRLVEAIDGGADVVNVSMGIPKAGYKAKPTTEWVAAVESDADEFERVIAAQPNKPLIVVAAGNDGWDAYWAVLPALATRLPDQVIAVAGTERFDGDGPAALWSKSSRNTSSEMVPHNVVEIAAPAVEVGALGQSGGAVYLDGTSFAAPLVAGTAGLLKQFDPRLTAREIKQYLLEGARAGGREVVGPMEGTLHVLNAHASLKLAARRSGAPLCGNRVWGTGGAVIVERTSTQRDTLSLTGVPARIDAMHGGKRIRVRAAQPSSSSTYIPDQHTEFRWSPNGWVSVPAPAGIGTGDPLPGSGGTYLSGRARSQYYSAWAYSHDRDTVAIVDWSMQEGGYGPAVLILRDSLRRTLATFEVGSVRGPATHKAFCVVEILSPLGNRCAEWDYYIPYSERHTWSIAYSPHRPEVLLARQTHISRASWSQMQACSSAYEEMYPHHLEERLQCRFHKDHVLQQGKSVVYSLELRPGATPREIWRSEADGEVRLFGIREDGSEAVVQHYADVVRWTVDYSNPARHVTTHFPVQFRCRTEFVDSRTFAPLVDAGSCVGFTGEGTISPSRSAPAEAPSSRGWPSWTSSWWSRLTGSRK